MEGAPDRREKGRECVEQPMASDSQCKIVAQARGSALAGKCSTRPAAEHTIWRSEMRLKRASGEHGCGDMEMCRGHIFVQSSRSKNW